MSERNDPGEAGAGIRSVPEGYHAVTPWIKDKEWIERMEYLQGSLAFPPDRATERRPRT